MPWCPNCRNEYKEGILTCVDCNAELVDTLEPEDDFKILAGLKQENHADKLIKFLESEKIGTVKEYSEEDEGYLISVHQKDLKKAKKLYQAFYTVETETLMQQKQAEASLNDELVDAEAAIGNEEDNEDQLQQLEDDTEENFPAAGDDAEENTEEDDPEEQFRKLRTASSTSYVKKSEKSKELRSTGITFLFFGIAGIIFTALNILEVIVLFNNMLSYVVMSIVFLGCLLIGIFSFKDAEKARKEAVEEEELTEALNQWMRQNITKDVIDSFKEPDKSDEINYFTITEGIKTEINKQFGEIDDIYLDSIIEEFYNKEIDAAP